MVYCTMFNPFNYKDVHSALRYTIRETRPPNLGIQEPVKSPNPVASHRTYYRDCVEFKSGINYYVTDIPSLHTQKKEFKKNWMGFYRRPPPSLVSGKRRPVLSFTRGSSIKVLRWCSASSFTFYFIIWLALSSFITTVSSSLREKVMARTKLSSSREPPRRGSARL